MIEVPEFKLRDVLRNFMAYHWDNLQFYLGMHDVEDAADVDAGVTINITQQGSQGVSEVTEVTFPADNGGSLQGVSWNISTPAWKYRVWYSVDGNGRSHQQPFENYVEVELSENDTASEVAQKTADALADTGDFTTSVSSATVEFTNVFTDARKGSDLYWFFAGVGYDHYEMFTQTWELFKHLYNDETRKVSITFGFPDTHAEPPHVSILLPSEEAAPKQTGITDDVLDMYDGRIRPENTHGFTVQYQLLISTNNYNELLSLYHYFKTLLLTGQQQFEFEGFRNMWVSGRDLSMNQEIQPLNFYTRGIMVQFYYENKVPAFDERPTADSITFNGDAQNF